MYNKSTSRMSTMTKTKIALAIALVLGGASAALASNDNEPSGGFVVSGSLDGVNPADHPGIFGNPATARSYGFVRTQQGTWEVAPSHTAPAAEAR
jgi:hypothetical protein